MNHSFPIAKTTTAILKSAAGIKDSSLMRRMRLCHLSYSIQIK